MDKVGKYSAVLTPQPPLPRERGSRLLRRSAPRNDALSPAARHCEGEARSNPCAQRNLSAARWGKVPPSCGSLSHGGGRFRRPAEVSRTVQEGFAVRRKSLAMTLYRPLLDCFGAPRLAMTLYRAKRFYRRAAAFIAAKQLLYRPLAAIYPAAQPLYQQLNS